LLPWLHAPVLASAELYDPTTGKFTPTGSMSVARSDASATLLPDGRVLMAGGYGCVARSCRLDIAHGEYPLASAELYDPTTGKFTRTGSMSVARSDAASMLLPDGRVLILLGGSKLAELYDPTTGKFTRDGSLQNDYLDASPKGRYVGAGSYSSAALLANGKVLVLGPTVADGPAAELFDPATGRPTSISLVLPDGVLERAKAGVYGAPPDTLTLLKDGRVLLCIYDYLVTYDPMTGSFTQSGSMTTPGDWLTAPTLLSDGRVLFAGGYAVTGGSQDTADAAGLYDPASGYQDTVSMPQARADHTATLLANGTVLIAGGTSDQVSILSSAELFRP
jgi:hypothetical protein